jgi:hypothetical protein
MTQLTHHFLDLPRPLALAILQYMFASILSWHHEMAVAALRLHRGAGLHVLAVVREQSEAPWTLDLQGCTLIF